MRTPSWLPHSSTSGACEQILEGQQWPGGSLLLARTEIRLVHTSTTSLDIKELTFLHTD